MRRARFLDAAADPAALRHAQHLLTLLLAQDGSTTRLCEAIAGGPIELHVLRQHATDDVPDLVRAQLPGSRFIERCTVLSAHGEVMMDNLSYVALDGLASDVRADLEAGRMPIGHLLARLWVRRTPLAGGEPLYERLWQTAGLPDANAARTYRIDTPEGASMVIAETFRHGMLGSPQSR